MAPTLVLTGPAGCGKTAVVRHLAAQHQLEVTEWINNVKAEFGSSPEDRELSVYESQRTTFERFLLRAPRYTNLTASAEANASKRRLILIELTDAQVEALAQQAGGDIRSALSTLALLNLQSDDDKPQLSFRGGAPRLKRPKRASPPTTIAAAMSERAAPLRDSDLVELDEDDDMGSADQRGGSKVGPAPHRNVEVKDDGLQRPSTLAMDDDPIEDSEED
ncbi:uncharacterized protein MONBRDRAFT_5377 [Monosiga brevicollis MX1]|uniref:Uncharacterized protein n=1 Tax=Monosiga brevicollis TaxID=81824 RepID=A9UQT3_MONBE|nr:uncharacterized protein MONBRDRAFT_5377 [Monosiga brevicollis MX1]EDQ92653.1 predicted protein [Monosiga brevicollis MX1]|eukprot:XP_001742415.1 hypothetical protein [Monosiga brevicollis MX1]